MVIPVLRVRFILRLRVKVICQIFVHIAFAPITCL